MTHNEISAMVLLIPVALLVLLFVGMNLYVRVKVKRRIRELHYELLASSPAMMNLPRITAELEECKEWLHHGWPEPGCIANGVRFPWPLDNYGFPYVPGKRYIKF